MKACVAVVLLTLVALPASALAQQAAVSADDLPVSLVRIKRQLREAQAHESRHGLKLTYYVSVVGETPPVNLFQDFDAVHGAVPFAAPTHQELFQQVTPKEFSAPPADLLGAAVWLGTRLTKKAIDSHRR